MATKKRTKKTIENELQAYIGLRFFAQEVEEYKESSQLAGIMEDADKRIAELIAEKYAVTEKTKKAEAKKEAPAKKVAAKQEPLKKAVAKKETVKKAQAKKTAAKKETVKRTAAKKVAAKKK